MDEWDVFLRVKHNKLHTPHALESFTMLFDGFIRGYNTRESLYYGYALNKVITEASMDVNAPDKVQIPSQDVCKAFCVFMHERVEVGGINELQEHRRGFRRLKVNGKSYFIDVSSGGGGGGVQHVERKAEKRPIDDDSKTEGKPTKMPRISSSSSVPAASVSTSSSLAPHVDCVAHMSSDVRSLAGQVVFRERAANALEESFNWDSSKPKVVEIAHIFAKGGCGKTSFASFYCLTRTQNDRYSFCTWINLDGADVHSQEKDFVGLLQQKLYLVQNHARCVGLHSKPLLRWLNEVTCEKPWLLIIDGLRHLEYWEALRRFLPIRGWGHIIITSRGSYCDRALTMRPLPPLTNEEAVQLMLVGNCSAEEEAEAKAAEQIVQAVDNLPSLITNIRRVVMEKFGHKQSPVCEFLNAVRNEKPARSGPDEPPLQFSIQGLSSLLGRGEVTPEAYINECLDDLFLVDRRFEQLCVLELTTVVSSDKIPLDLAELCELNNHRLSGDLCLDEDGVRDLWHSYLSELKKRRGEIVEVSRERGREYIELINPYYKDYFMRYSKDPTDKMNRFMDRDKLVRVVAKSFQQFYDQFIVTGKYSTRDARLATHCQELIFYAKNQGCIAEARQLNQLREKLLPIPKIDFDEFYDEQTAGLESSLYWDGDLWANPQASTISTNAAIVVDTAAVRDQAFGGVATASTNDNAIKVYPNAK